MEWVRSIDFELDYEMMECGMYSKDLDPDYEPKVYIHID